jgi:membrane protein YqaA with SNARE-associated domain
MLGYAIGYFLFETVGEPILRFYGLTAEFSSFAERFNEQGWIIVLIAGFTPLPYKVITIAAGATAMPLHILLFASVIARSARFFLVAALLWKFGEPMKRIIDRHFGLITIAVAILGIGGFVAVRYLL